MLRWDVTKKTTWGKGILGTVVAFSAADEEQGRKTLHCHWQIWVTEINETVWNCLFHEDITIWDRARKTFCELSVNVITASYGAELCITHNCLNENNDVVCKHEMVQKKFKSRTHVFSDEHVTKNYVLRFKEDLCHALTVARSFLHLTLSTVVFNSGETLSFQATDY
jgi:hypothetical protein